MGPRPLVTTAERPSTRITASSPIGIETRSPTWAPTTRSSAVHPVRASLKVCPASTTCRPQRLACKGVFTNTTPVDAYRGAGRPEAIYADRAAWTGRRASWASTRPSCAGSTSSPRPSPTRTARASRPTTSAISAASCAPAPTGRLAGLRGAPGAASRRAGRCAGSGSATTSSRSSAKTPRVHAKIVFADDGMREIYVGTQSNGQGHETVYAQFLARTQPASRGDRIAIVQGDSDRIATRAAAPAARARSPCRATRPTSRRRDGRAFRRLPRGRDPRRRRRPRLRRRRFRLAGTDRASRCWTSPRWHGPAAATTCCATESRVKLPGRSYPNGAHVAEVEVDPETGVVTAWTATPWSTISAT
jgi:aerobic carbon-monoxide dehydrogenase large subunit